MGEIAETELLPAVRSLDSTEFEQFVAALWEVQGWDTEVTGQSGDRGIDVVATRSFPLEIQLHIQAKRYGVNSSVSGPEMQKYGSLTRRPDVDIAAVVTSGSFTSQASSLADEFGIKLVNGEMLERLIQDLHAEELLLEYIEEADVRQIDPTTHVPDNSPPSAFAGSPHGDEDLKPSPAVAAGEFLQLELVGAEYKSGYLQASSQENGDDNGFQARVREIKRGRLEPIGGLVLAFEVTNLSEVGWEFMSQNSNDGGGAVVGFDSSGFSYEAIRRLEYAHRSESSRNWQWGRATIRPNSRSRIATWLNVGEDTEIIAIEYKEKIWRATEKDVDFDLSEKIQMSFPRSVEEVVGELPKPIARCIGD